jgi:hypothetical protein
VENTERKLFSCEQNSSAALAFFLEKTIPPKIAETDVF